MHYKVENKITTIFQFSVIDKNLSLKDQSLPFNWDILKEN